jgi:DNA modification methylase
MYVAHGVEIATEMMRVLRKDGTFWLNLGDCYATGAGKVGDCPGGGKQGDRWMGRDDSKGRGTPKRADGSGGHTYLGPTTQPNRMPIAGLKPKDLVGIPWRVAFALQEAGWYLRSEIIWHKPNPMPESVTDRPTRAHEQIFLLAKSERYYYNADAIREPANGWNGSSFTDARDKLTKPGLGQSERIERDGRNKRSVWMVTTEPYPEAHFATFPTALVEPCILAGCPLDGVVCDPFGGSGTVGEVASKLGRRAIIMDLNPDYCEMARRRCDGVAPLFLPATEIEASNPDHERG